MTQRVIEEILSQEEICSNHFKMKVKAPQIAKEAKPGQFVHIQWVSQLKGTDPLLRRPISINGVNIDEGSITIIYRVVGRGTKLLSQLRKGDKLDIMGPIGNGFSISQAKKKFLVVGGGMGIAPLLPIVKELITRDKEVVLLLGAETKEQLLNLTEYQDLDLQLKVATVDGSAGQQGFVRRFGECRLCLYLWSIINDGYNSELGKKIRD